MIEDVSPDTLPPEIVALIEKLTIKASYDAAGAIDRVVATAESTPVQIIVMINAVMRLVISMLGEIHRTHVDPPPFGEYARGLATQIFEGVVWECAKIEESDKRGSATLQ
jgi:hypothetical protein